MPPEREISVGHTAKALEAWLESPALSRVPLKQGSGVGCKSQDWQKGAVEQVGFQAQQS